MRHTLDHVNSAATGTATDTVVTTGQVAGGGVVFGVVPPTLTK